MISESDMFLKRLTRTLSSPQVYWSEAFSVHCQTSNIERFCKTSLTTESLLTNFAKRSILDV